MGVSALARGICGDGDWLREHGTRGLLRFGLVALLVGGAWSLLLPWNKNLWTSTYAVWTAGWAT